MNELNRDVIYYLNKYITNPNDLKNLSKLNPRFSRVYNKDKNAISRFYLNLYKVNFENPNDFIYKFNNVNQNEFIENGKWKYQSLFKLYMKHFNEIRISTKGINYGITSFPIYPNLEEINIKNNPITILPSLPKLYLCEADNVCPQEFNYSENEYNYDED
jgi:hypothetical protein